MTPQKKGREPHPRKGSDQPLPRLPQCALPCCRTTPKPTNGASSAPVTVREDTPWPSTGKMLGNLFEERNWVLPKDYLAIEDKKEDATIAKPPPIEESKEDANLPHLQEQLEGQQQKPLPKPQAKRPDKLSITKMRQQWEEEMERLNTKYNLDCFSDSELDSESDEDEGYQYEHGYETLI